LKYSKEIIGHINSIAYYCDEIGKAIRKQIEEDSKIETNVAPQSIRFACMVAIDGSCASIKDYCKCIEVNVKTAEEQDKNLRFKEQEENIETIQNS
jgi:hypothetical protein